MSDLLVSWLALLVMVVVLAGYELKLMLMQRRDPARLARSAHANLRQEWFVAMSAQSGSEILAVQALRNSMMSATMVASTAALGLIGTVTMAAPSLHIDFAGGMSAVRHLSIRLVLELLLMILLFAALVSSTMAVRFYNHVSFIGSMPVGSEARRRWTPVGIAYARRAGLLYSWGLRHLILVAPILASILHPYAGPPAAVAIVLVLYGFDRADTPGTEG
ncbi:MAG: DUF599 domain-containing protein [Burkholderiales bacterium]|nr:DUF599 domain-containing protein [Burkholderiales bacterium]